MVYAGNITGQTRKARSDDTITHHRRLRASHVPQVRVYRAPRREPRGLDAGRPAPAPQINLQPTPPSQEFGIANPKRSSLPDIASHRSSLTQTPSLAPWATTRLDIGRLRLLVAGPTNTEPGVGVHD